MLNDDIEVIWPSSWSKSCTETVWISKDLSEELETFAMVVFNLGCKSLAIVFLSALNLEAFCNSCVQFGL